MSFKVKMPKKEKGGSKGIFDIMDQNQEQVGKDTREAGR